MESSDIQAVERQLGRAPRGLRRVAYRCPCGLPAVVETAPRLPDGTPFPTLYYLTCPKAASAIGKLESDGVMKEMQARLAEDPELAASYQAAHEDYLARRDRAAEEEGVEPLPPGTQSTGGMPLRVKCLHALVAHELAAPGSNPFGREALAMLPDWWSSGPCVHAEDSPPTPAETSTVNGPAAGTFAPDGTAAEASAERQGTTPGRGEPLAARRGTAGTAAESPATIHSEETE